MLLIIKKHTVRTIVIKIIIAAYIPLELKRGHVTVRMSTHVLILASHQL